MRKILNRGAKRRLRRKQQSARRSRNRSFRGMEPLEDRRLLAVSPDGNWGQLFGPGLSLAGTVTREFTVPFGADGAIAVAANYTQSTNVQLAIDLDKDGSIEFLLDSKNAQLNGDPLDVGKPEEFVQGHTKMQVVGNEILNSTIWLIPIGANVMGRDVRVTLTGGVTTDFIATTGSYHGVDQKDPIGTVADAGSTATSFSLLSFGPVDEGDVTLDAVLVLGKAGVPVTDLVPDPLTIDSSKIDQTEIFDVGHNPSVNNFLRGAASFDDDDDTDGDALPNTVAMDWNFLPSGGVAGFAHAAVNINMTKTPGVGFEFDFGDAPDTYPTTFAKNGPFHAPKGPTLGTLRDKEADAKLPLDGTGDDVNGVDDEEGVTLFETNGGVVPPTPPNAGAFIFQQGGTNTGSVTVEVTGLDPDGKGGFVPAYVTGYIDFNDDGDFNDAGELVIKGEEVTKAGKVEYSFPIPSAAAGTKAGGTFMRVRLSNATMGDAKILPPGGHASSGEVEDYPVELVAGAEINGLKFEDLDADGVRDLGEPGMANVIMQLRDKANMPVKDLFNITVKDVLTDANGKFAFANLKFGDYIVVEDLVNTDTNLDKVKDFSDTIAGITVKQGLMNSTPLTKAVTLDAKTPINSDVLFGNFITGSIHGVKFHDLDGDGIFDDGEPRLGGIKFDLFKFVKTTVTIKATGGGTFTKYNWADVGDAVTDVHGEFWFTDLVPGIYEVRETPDANLKQTTPQPTKSPNATDLNNDKDFVDAGEAGLDPATSLTKYEIISRREFVWQLGAASRIMDLDFDAPGPGPIHPDGKIDQNEIDIAKAKGALKVEVLATPAVDAAPADKLQDLWFGNTLLSKIDGVKFENVDGSKDGSGQPTFTAGDLLLAGVKMVLKDANGKETVVVTDADPDKDGKNFVFNGVVAGTYTVFESTATDTNNDKIADNTQEMDLDPFIETVTVTSGKNATLKHSFGNFVRGSIHGVKFDDLDGDGIWDKNRTGLPVEEPRLPGVKFDLYKFIKTTVKTPSSLSGPVTTYFWEDVGDATSDVHGEFWFTGLLAGKYEVRERAGQPFMQTTKQPTAPPDGKFNPATSTSLFEIVSRREFVWELDPTLVLAGGPGSDTANEQTQLKDAQSGAFNRPMDGVGGTKDGFIDSGEVLAAYNKAALKVQVLATPGQDDGEANAPGRDLWFGNVRAGQIVGFKFEDRDQSGTYDPAIDVPMKNVTMLLKGNDANGKLVELSTKTAADGSFSFGGLLPSDAAGYSIFESDKTDTNNDGTPDSPAQELILDTTVANVVLSSGETKTLDKNLFGNFILGSIHGFKFHDKDADGIRDAGEEPLKDVVFDLYKFQKTETLLLASNVTKNIFHWIKVQQTAKTDSHGEFWFTGLEAGKYQVVENKGTMLPTTGQPTTSPVPVDNTGDGKFIDAKDFQGADPSKAASVFTIRSRWEYVWEFGASSRPRDLDTDSKDPGFGLIDPDEIQMAYNKSVLKTEILAAPNAPSTLFDSGGFEAPSYTTTAFGTGMLEGQPIGAPIVWQRTVNASPSTANIQNTVFAPGGGTQAVQMNRTAGAVDRWGLKFTNAPLTNTVTITWAMRVQGPAGNPASQFGPFFGVEAYDDTSGFIALIGSLGVDATTGDVLLQEATTGFFVETGATAAFGAWNNFEIRMNFTTKQYSVFFNGAFLRTEGFVDQANKPGGINRITDATLTGLTAAANSDALTGTAYFDNFLAKDIGAPAAPSLWFGNAFAGTINGFKYEDVNNDGKFDAAVDKPGNTWGPLGQNQKGATFELKDVNGKVVQTTVSDKDTGKFTFLNVLPGKYTVTESTATDTNNDKVADNQQDLVLDTRVATVELASVAGGQTKDAGNFRNFVLGSIHGFKFQDFNGNGVRDPGESPWQGIKFDLFKLTKQEKFLLASNKEVTVYTWVDSGDATTDLHGEFWFTGLDPGFYYTVREKENQNYEQTTPQLTKSPVAIDANKDGDFFDVGDFAGLDPLTKDNAGIPSSFLILSRYEFQWATGAYNRPRDLNNDGIIDASEQTMALNKSILKLPQPLADGKDGSPGNLIFGNMFVTGSIHGFKFEDIDADGVWDQSNPKGTGAEPGLGGIWIELRDSVTGKVAILANGDLAQTKTAGGDNPNTQRIEHKGEFWFVGVLPGTYTLNEILEKSDSNGDLIPDSKQGLVNSTPIQTGPITIGPRQEWVYKPGAAQLTPGQIAKGIHEVFEDGTSKNNVNEKLIFGNYITGSIHGFKFLDLNADGIYDPSAMGKERPFEWGVFELLDMSGKSLGIQFSNEDGEFWFTDLRPGKYTVRERPDLTDRNDIDGDGFPDMVDNNGDGFPESMGNGIPDTKEGLKLSTPIERTVQIWSREELVWQAGAAMLGGSSTVNVNNDKFAHLQNISGKFDNVTLSEAITGSPIFAVTPFTLQATTPPRVFGWDVQPASYKDSFGFAGNAGIFQAQFAVPVTSVSIDVISNSGNDRGVLFAFDENGQQIALDMSALLNDTDVNPNNDWETLTVTAPAGKKIVFIQAGGDGLSASDVGLDNLQYVVDPLKEEKLVGTQLMWGNFYAGAIHGLKLQQDSNRGAPNIPIKLINQAGQTVATTTTNANGEFWFLDVTPGFYTIAENPTPSVIVMAMPVPVVVGHAQVVVAPGATAMPYPGLQTTVSNSSLVLRNLIEGSIHGLVCNQANQPIAGVTVVLAGPENAQTTTNAQGQFHFNDLTPGAYAVNVNGIIRVVIVGSGEEEVAMAGLASPLDPGQFETLNPDLKIIIQGGPVDTVGPKVASVKVVSSEWTEPFLDEVDTVDGLGYPIPTGADQLKTLPWININEILVKFNEPMNITAADISLHGVSVANYATAFNYDAPSRTASIQLTGGLFINADKLVLHVNDTAKDLAGNALDGEWVNGVSNFGNMGNGTAGGDFNFRVNVLPGDSRQDGQNLGAFDGVLGTDVIKVRNAQFLITTDAAYSPFDDVNGSGNVSGVDVVAVRNRQFTGLPVGNPVAPPASGASLVDSVFGAGASFGKGDDDDLLLALATGSGSSSDAVFESSDGGDSDGEAGAVGSIDDLFAALGS